MCTVLMPFKVKVRLSHRGEPKKQKEKKQEKLVQKHGYLKLSWHCSVYLQLALLVDYLQLALLECCRQSDSTSGTSFDCQAPSQLSHD